MSDLSQYNPVEYVQTLLARIGGGDLTAVQELRDADVSDTDIKTALEGVTEDPDAVADGYDAAGDDIDSKLQYIQGLADNNQIINDVDQSAHVDGTVHGDVYDESDSNVANATGEGSIAGEEVYGNQVQTGDGQQVGGDSGVQNQGDNSGQQAGYDATADNVTSGDNNTVGSGWSSGVGDGHTSLENVDVNDSALSFGEGDATTHADDNYTENLNYETNIDTNDSGNFYESDDDSQVQTVTINDDNYDGSYGEPEYKGDDYDGHDEHHFGDDNEVHQHAEIDDFDPIN